MGNRVAVKVFKEGQNDKEIRICGLLGSHPYVMEVFGYSVKLGRELFGHSREKGRKALVMKEYECSMKTYLEDRKGKLTVKERKRLLVKVAKGVEYLESKGIIHRDIKVLVGMALHP